MCFRLLQGQQGIVYLDTSNTGFSLQHTLRADLNLNDLLPAFTEPLKQKTQPQTNLTEGIVEQIMPEACLAGVAPVITLRLTEVVDGSMLATSCSHTFSRESGSSLQNPTRSTWQRGLWCHEEKFPWGNGGGVDYIEITGCPEHLPGEPASETPKPGNMNKNLLHRSS